MAESVQKRICQKLLRQCSGHQTEDSIIASLEAVRMLAMSVNSKAAIKKTINYLDTLKEQLAEEIKEPTET